MRMFPDEVGGDQPFYGDHRSPGARFSSPKALAVRRGEDGVPRPIGSEPVHDGKVGIKRLEETNPPPAAKGVIDHCEGLLVVLFHRASDDRVSGHETYPQSPCHEHQREGEDGPVLQFDLLSPVSPLGHWIGAIRRVDIPRKGGDYLLHQSHVEQDHRCIPDSPHNEGEAGLLPVELPGNLQDGGKGTAVCGANVDFGARLHIALDRLPKAYHLVFALVFPDFEGALDKIIEPASHFSPPLLYFDCLSLQSHASIVKIESTILARTFALVY